MERIKIGQIGIGHNHGAEKMTTVRKFPELFEVLSPYKDTPLSGVFHSFTGTVEEAEELLTYERFLIGIGKRRGRICSADNRRVEGAGLFVMHCRGDDAIAFGQLSIEH